MRYLLIVLVLVVVPGCVNFAKRDQDRRSSYVSAHPDISSATRADILRGSARPGMTIAEVYASWGRPSRVHRSGNRSGVSEQWVYMSGQYIYFENGIMTSWQN